MLDAISAMREAGYSDDDDILELIKDVWEHPERGGQRPHAFGHREPCPRCGKPW